MGITCDINYLLLLWLQCVCMITTGAISISKMMMVNHSLQHLTGVRSLAAALSSNHTIRELWLNRNPITVEGALLIVKSAVHNTVCQDVHIDADYQNDKVKMMMNILWHRRRQNVRECVV